MNGMLLDSLLILSGFLMLIFGADWMVYGASSLARKYRIPDLVIGLTIVAFGTSAPELVVNAISSFSAKSELVFGNILGSNIFNLFVILGIVGVICPISVKYSTIWKEIPISLIAVIILWIIANGWIWGQENVLSRLDGMLLLLCFFLFLWYIFRQMKSEDSASEESAAVDSGWKISFLIVTGLALLVLGGQCVVNNAVSLASGLGVSEKVIGLTIVAAGTSLPELMTSLMAALRRNPDIAIGNVVGSNIFNLFLILGCSALIRPVPYALSFNFEIYFLVAGTVFLFAAMFTGQVHKLDRWEAAVLFISFIMYTAYSLSS